METALSKNNRANKSMRVKNKNNLQWVIGGSEANDNEKLTVLATGDLAPIGRPEYHLKQGNVQRVFNGVLPLIKNSDLTIANLECPLTRCNRPILKIGPSLKASPQVAPALKEAGFSVLTLANNHILDYGEQGIKETITSLEKNQINYTGVGANSLESCRPLFVERKGHKIAILDFAEHEFNWQGRSKWGTWPLKPEENVLQIQTCRQKADIVLAFVHGGLEYTSVPRPRMISICRAFVEAGAHAVVCHHTHSIMGIEIHNGVPIVYNLGNFLFDLPMMRDLSCWKIGLALRLMFQGQYLFSLDVIPIYLDSKSGCIRSLEGGQLEIFGQHFLRLCDFLTDLDQAEFMWKLFCVSRVRTYLLDIAKSVVRTLPHFFYSAVRTLFLGKYSNACLRASTIKGINLWRSLFLCESHNEAVTTIIEIIRDESWDAYKEQLPLLKPFLDFEINSQGSSQGGSSNSVIRSSTLDKKPAFLSLKMLV